jgi:hypothetical protein
MKMIKIEDAVGKVLCHDITRIVPGKFKGRAFKKGHVIEKHDIPNLLDLGKNYIYALDLKQGDVHENDAGSRIAKSAVGQGVCLTEPVEGKVNIKACVSGLLKVNAKAVYQVNETEEIIFASLHTNQQVEVECKVAATRIVPLVTSEEKIRRVEEICRQYRPVIEVKPFISHKVGIVTTGTEVYEGRIKDKFGPVVNDKFNALGSKIIKQVFVPDDTDRIAHAIQDLIAEGAEMVAVTGGMSVDPDDKGPDGIIAAGGKVISYGAPVLPGTMFMMAYIKDVPVVGLPGGIMYYKSSVFDLVVPRILAGESITRADIISLGHGGMCAWCDDCRYPVCGFGKG